MYPILTELHLFGATRPVGGYGLCVAIGIMITGLLFGRAAYRAKEDIGGVIASIGYTAGAGFLGAWLFFLFVEWARGASVSEALAHGGGLVFYGAVPTGILASYFSARAMKVDWWKMMDLGIPAIAIGHAFGRIGCLMGGCCFGAEWHGPWAITFTHPMSPASHPSVPRHPTQLYEALGLAIIALVFALTPLDAKWLGKPGSGQRAASYLVAYGILRIAVEACRGDGIRGIYFGFITTSQLVSIVGIALGLFGIWRAMRTPRTLTTA